jgi:kinesin family member 1
LLDGYWRLIQNKLADKQSTGDNIVVVTRTRPFNDREIEQNTTKCVRVLEEDATGQQQVWIVNPNAPEAGPVKFSFDYCFDSFDPKDENFIDQKTVFDTVGLDLLAKTWSGYNSSLFAYGQTGSGKTYSIMGYDKAKGLIPRICGLLFYMIDTHGRARGLQVEATYLEIYQV